jgi:DNA polymerase-3 subunit beta
MQKLIVDTTTLLATAMRINNKGVSKKSVMPIIENLKFDVTPTQLTITSTDLENFMLTTIPCQSDDSFSFLLPSSELKLVEKLDTGSLTITVDEENENVVLTTNDETVNVALENVDDYPITPSISETVPIGKFGSAFIDELKGCLDFVSKDDLRPAMTGVNFQVENGNVELCATDAHLMRVAKVEGENITDAASLSFIMNAKQCKLITSFKKLSAIKIDAIINDSISHTVMSFDAGENLQVQMIGRNIESRFPDYQGVIPTSHLTEVTVNKNELGKRIDKAMLYANSVTYQGVFSINGNVKLTSKNVDFKKEYTCEMPHVFKLGEDVEIGFNMSFLKKVLGHVEGETVNIKMSYPSKPAIIEQGNTLMLIMPVVI